MRVVLADYQPGWSALFEREAGQIRQALGDRALAVEHVGSTSVPGLAAKPVIDIVLVVPDSTDEQAYVPALVAAGYEFRLRETLDEHRLLRRQDPPTHVHTYSIGCPEIDKLLLFRNWLRTHADERTRYEQAKRQLAEKDWGEVQDYADAKSEVVEDIVSRARAGG